MAVRRSVLQCEIGDIVDAYDGRPGVAVCCSVSQCVAVCCSVFQCVAVCRSVLHCKILTLWTSTIGDLVLQCVAVCCNVLQCVAVRCSVLQRAAT